MPHGLHPSHSSGCSCHPLELNQPADVVAEVHHANLEPRPHDANGAHNLAAGHALDVSAEVLPPHDLLDRFQRITFGADRLKPALNIEKARLPHDSLAPSAHGPLPSASQIRSDLARRIFRGALESYNRVARQGAAAR